MASGLIATDGSFSTPAIFKAAFKLFGSQGCSHWMTKTDLTFQAFSSRFVDFAAQFCIRCKFLFHETNAQTLDWSMDDVRTLADEKRNRLLALG